MATINTCKTCKYWEASEHFPVCHGDLLDEDGYEVKVDYKVKYCSHDKFFRNRHPEGNAAAIFNDRGYPDLLTSENFGCVLHEPKD